MNNIAYIQNNILKAILTVCDKEARKIVQQVEMDYGQLSSSLGKADATSKVEQLTRNMIVLSIFGTGQKALIGEYGKGSKMDRNNPALDDYINGGIFNKERLKHNLAVIARSEDEKYYDLDKNLWQRPKPPKPVNLEKLRTKNGGLYQKFQPVEPKYIIKKAIEQRLDRLLEEIAVAVAAESKIERLFDGLRFTVKL